VTVRAAYPAPATTAFAVRASGSVPHAAAATVAARSWLMSDVTHSTAAAAAGTDRLSLSPIGMVSTAAAAIVATTGIQTVNQG
jgi:hypothetical protein